MSFGSKKKLICTQMQAFRSQISEAKWVVLDSNGSSEFLKDAVEFCRQLKVPGSFPAHRTAVVHT